MSSLDNRILPRLAIVIPCYNEEEVLTETSKRLEVLLATYKAEALIAPDSYVLLVDDGSRDHTWMMIEQLFQAENSIFRGLKLSRNFGHQNALLAGLHYVEDADIVISIDADLQDDLNAIQEMVLKYKAGADIVYAVRDDRSTDSKFKRTTALAFYKILNYLGVESVYNHADYRLISQRGLTALKEFKEYNLYLRGMVPMIGFKSEMVYYKRGTRFAGTSKYNFSKMLSFAWNGISSLSIKPLRFVTMCGFFIFLISIGLSVYVLISYIYKETAVGWASTVLPMYFLGGVQLLCIGLIGEYVAKIYSEVKARPRFIIETHLK